MTSRWLHALGTALALFLASAAGSAAHAEVTLRMAAIAPDGTAWARELRAFARDVESATRGEVKMKWYLGGIAGDEATALERAKRGQIDGLAGAVFCETLSPSLRVLRVVGMFENRDEVGYVLGKLKPQLDEEMRKQGFANLADSVFGADVWYSRRPVRTMADLRATRWWMWTQSPMYLESLPEMGIRLIPGTLDDLVPFYTRGDVDGFIMPPSVALAFQWSTLASYFTPLDTGMLTGCLVLANHALDPLSLETQEQIRATAARFRIRWNEVTAGLDQSLIDVLFAKQGLKRVDVSPQVRAEFFAAARAVRPKLSQRQVSRELVQQVEKLLQDYRQELLR